MGSTLIGKNCSKRGKFFPQRVELNPIKIGEKNKKRKGGYPQNGSVHLKNSVSVHVFTPGRRMFRDINTAQTILRFE